MFNHKGLFSRMGGCLRYRYEKQVAKNLVDRWATVLAANGESVR